MYSNTPLWLSVSWVSGVKGHASISWVSKLVLGRTSIVRTL